MNKELIPHKHAEVIKAWAEGETIEFLNSFTKQWGKVEGNPSWLVDTEYRIKPKEQQ